MPLTDLNLGKLLVCLALTFLLLAGRSFAEQQSLQDSDVVALGKACQDYLMVADDGADTVIDFARKIGERVSQRVLDTGVDRDTAYRDIAVDWMSDNRGALERRELKAVLLACWWFAKLVDGGIGLPTVVRENITPEDVRGFVKFLNEQTRRKRDVKDKGSRHGKGGGTSP
jgi:hypothetical protein